MRLRLVHTLSLLLLSAVLLAVLAMAVVTSWNLRNGFGDYLNARDVERLEQFAEVVVEAARQAGGADALLDRRLSMRDLLDDFARRQGIEPRRSGPPPGGGETFGSRVSVVSVDGRPLLGRGRPADDGAVVDRPIRLQGEVVALARLKLMARVPDAVESRFLVGQYRGIVGVALACMLLALGSAWWVARHWARPLVAMQDATARIARGETGVRLVGRHQGEARGDEIGDLVRNVNRMAEALQRLEGARRRWVADISHELRTPLAVLRGEIEALIDGVRPLSLQAVRSLQDEVLRLGALVDDLHLLAMSDLQALPCRFAPLEAPRLVQQLVQRFEGRAAAAGLSLTLLPVAGTATTVERVEWVEWDQARIGQLLGNLLENSLRYTNAPGRIELALRCSAHSLQIDIDDSAPGVPADDLPRLFEPLYRADAARSRHRGGSGLGLAIAEAIVRSHGGRIEAGPSALGGLQVRIELPRVAGDAA